MELVAQAAREGADVAYYDPHVPVIRPTVAETTALGAAYAAGLAVGFWKEVEDLRANWGKDKEWDPKMPKEEVDREYGQWKKAVTRTFDWMEQ